MKLFLFYILTFIWLVFTGCSNQKNIIHVDKAPEATYKEPLPAFEGTSIKKNFNLGVKLLISEEGNVKAVELENSSGDRGWDTLAVIQLLKWKYTPAVYKDEIIPIWIRQNIKVHIIEKYKIQLAEIVCNSKATADSIYIKILNGEEFSLLAREYSIADSKSKFGYLGLIDLRNYSYSIQFELEKLRIGEITFPLKNKGNYCIYKRMEY